MTYPRLEKLYKAMETAGIDAIAVNPGPSLTYMTGLNFHLMERPIVLFFSPGKDPAIILPELELLKLENLPYKVQPFPYGEDPAQWLNSFNNGVKRLDIDGCSIGIEPRALRMLEYRFIEKAAPSSSFPDASNVFSSLRNTKDTHEIEKIKIAVNIAQNALIASIPLIKIGMTEQELASELTIQLLRNGSSPEFPFAPIVSGGPNSANPHASPSFRKLEQGDLLVIDWGAAFEGYISDLTRTFAVGKIDPEFEKIHGIVQKANSAGMEAGMPGLPCSVVDKAARDVIEKSGFGKYFTHRTGHGIGMEGHEDPYIRGDNLQLLETGMVYTVEPGIYIPNRNGVRIEDNIVVTSNGTECLSTLNREIVIVG